jgi:aromatic amino acid aminotransferase I
MTTAMLNKYTFDGYIRWLRGIKALYKMKRNWLCDTFEDVFHIEFEDNANGVISNQLVREVFEGMGRGVTCYAKPLPGSSRNKWDEKKGIESVHGPALVSFIPPTAGMFVWLAIHVDQHPDYRQLQAKGEDATRVLMEKLWHELADNLVRPSCISKYLKSDIQVLFAPGWAFDAHGEHAIGGNGVGYFRLAYSTTTYEQTRDAITTFSKVLTKFFKV